MHNGRQQRKYKKKEELPSFLKGLTAPPEDFTITTKGKSSLQYLGPIFFGRCSAYQHHPPAHSLKLGSFHQPQYGMLPGSGNISKLLLPQFITDQQVKVKKEYFPKIKRQKIYRDPYPHKCIGKLKKFIPEISPHVVDLGKSQSIIEGEAAVEMPLCRVSSRGYKRKSKPELDFSTFSDVREKNRIYMSYKERIAHAHFPKEFTTVRIIGPTIPASITVTKLPSKRETQSELTLELKPKQEKEAEEEKDEVRERVPSSSASSEKHTITSDVFDEEEIMEEEIEPAISETISEREEMEKVVQAEEKRETREDQEEEEYQEEEEEYQEEEEGEEEEEEKEEEYEEAEGEGFEEEEKEGYWEEGEEGEEYQEGEIEEEYQTEVEDQNDESKEGGGEFEEGEETLFDETTKTVEEYEGVFNSEEENA